ncbi:family 10 glycosylhydrolase [Kiritimatiellaeota bacterium B1221]|nr:family 10 glycosylhydrolase [Kiritimatiellaeota bacterium B1221]
MTLDASVWKASPESPLAVQTGIGLRFPCVFDGNTDRVYWDLSLSENWTERDGLWITYRLENLQSMRAVTLYLKSGAGWYASYLPVKEGLQSVFLPFENFEEIDQPQGWEAVDGVRLSPWKGEAGEGAFQWYGLAAVKSPILVVDPDAASSLNPSEQAFGVERAAWMARQLSEMGIATRRLSDAKASSADLQAFDCVILPYNAYPSPALLQSLARYMEDGGKVMVFYSASPELAESCGFSLRRYLSSNSEQKWNAVKFTDASWQGPARVRMPTRNILPVSPGDRAAVLAEWVDRSGRRQKESAIVRSDRALWVSTVLPQDDSPEQRQLLAGLLDELLPEMHVAETAVKRRVSRFRLTVSPGEVNPQTARQLSEIETALDAGHPFLAWDQFIEMNRQADVANAENFEAPAFEMRGIWDASGQGLASENWETTVEILENAGITDLFVYVPRNRGNPIRVLRAAEGRVAVHAWHICWSLPEHSPATLRRYAREDLLQISETGEAMPWLCPSRPENVESEIRRILVLAETDGIRGVHLDYVRWQDSKPCACAACKDAFQKSLGKKVDWPAALRGGPQHPAFLEWQALQIDLFVEKVSTVMKDVFPDIYLSAAVWPSLEVSQKRIGQNWTHWNQKGLLDFIVVMNYTENVKNFKKWIVTQRKLVGHSAKLMVGIGVDSSESRLSPRQVLTQISAASELGANGFVLFQLNPSFASELAPVLSKAYSPREKK